MEEDFYSCTYFFNRIHSWGTNLMAEVTEQEQEVFDFLDALRESGITNMYGAAPYIQDEFGVDKKEARELLLEWMKNF